MRIHPLLLLALLAPVAMTPSVSSPALAGAERAAVPVDEAATPSREERLDLLYEGLRVSEDADAARQFERQIVAIWAESGSPTADLLLDAGTRLMNDGELAHALDLFYAVIELQPDFAEGWNKRATLYFLLDEYDLSLADIDRVLELEPRHFGALSGRGMIMSELDRKEDAYEAFRRALAVNPFLPGLKARVQALHPEVRGRSI